MFTKQIQEIRLPLWSEIVGKFRQISSDEYFIYLRINQSVLSFPKNSNEASYIQEKLDENLIEKRIGVLRTDLRDKPLVVRVIS